MKLGKVGLVGRFKPLHNGAELMLASACAAADEVIIAIGSANKYNLRNPFTAEETMEMIGLTLQDKFSNYRVVPLDDHGDTPQGKDGNLWVEQMKKAMGRLDYFITGNPYVQSLLEHTYTVIAPAAIIPADQRIMINATEIRNAMVKGDAWKDLVPNPVASYITTHGLDQRFRRDFGALAMPAVSPQTLEEEIYHAHYS